LTNSTRKELYFLPIVVAGLFLFVIWQSSGISLSLAPDSADVVKEMRYQDLAERGAGNASIFEQLMWFVAGLTGIILHFLNRDRALSIWARAWPLLLLLAFVMLSVVWSLYPDIAFRRAIKHLLLLAALAGVVVGVRSPRELLRLAVIFTGLLMVLNLASVILLPGVATDLKGAIQGLHGHKNTAGVVAMISIFVWLSAARASQGAWTRLILYSGTLLWFAFLIATYSRTSILCTALAIFAIVPLGYCVRKPKAGVILATFASLAILCSVFVLVLQNVSFADLVDFLEGEKTTLSGRAAVWEIAYKAFLDRPMLGTGYESLWSTSDLPPAEEYSDQHLTNFMIGLTQAHNGYLDVLATLGAFGAVVFSIFLAGVTWTETRTFISFRHDADRRAVIELGGFVLVASLIHNVSQTTFLRGSILWVFLLLCYLLVCSLRTRSTAGLASPSGRTIELSQVRERGSE